MHLRWWWSSLPSRRRSIIVMLPLLRWWWWTRRPVTPARVRFSPIVIFQHNVFLVMFLPRLRVAIPSVWRLAGRPWLRTPVTAAATATIIPSTRSIRGRATSRIAGSRWRWTPRSPRMHRRWRATTATRVLSARVASRSRSPTHWRTSWSSRRRRSSTSAVWRWISNSLRWHGSVRWHSIIRGHTIVSFHSFFTPSFVGGRRIRRHFWVLYCGWHGGSVSKDSGCETASSPYLVLLLLLTLLLLLALLLLLTLQLVQWNAAVGGHTAR